MLGGEKEYPSKEVSGEKNIMTELSLTKGGFSDQRVRFNFFGDNLEEFTKEKEIFVDVYVEGKNQGEILIQKSDHIRNKYYSVNLPKEKKIQVHHSLLRRSEGAYFVGIPVSLLVKSVEGLKFNIVFTEKLPPGTFMKTRVTWSDGP
jgi:hypothetical protein